MSSVSGETPSRPRVDQSYSHELPSLPTMRPVDSDGEEEEEEEYTEDMSNPNFDMSYSYSIPTATPSAQSSSTTTPSFLYGARHAPSSVATSSTVTPSQGYARDTPLARYRGAARKNPYAQETPRPFNNPSTPNNNANTPFSSTPASYQSARSRNSLGSANRSIRSTLISTASPRSRFSRAGSRGSEYSLNQSLASKYDLSGISAATPSMASESYSSIRPEDSFNDEPSLRNDQFPDESLLEDQNQLLGLQEEGNSFASFGPVEEGAETTGGGMPSVAQENGEHTADDRRYDESQRVIEVGSREEEYEAVMEDGERGEEGDESGSERRLKYEQEESRIEEGDSFLEENQGATSFDLSRGFNSRSRLVSADLSLVLEAEEESEESTGPTKSLVDAPTPDLAARTTYVQLGLRRSRSAAPRLDAPPSPASSSTSATSATSGSRAPTPNGASQHSQQLDVNPISLPLQSDDDISEDSLTGEPRSMLSENYLSPLKDTTNLSLSTPGGTSYGAFSDVGTPYRKPMIKDFTIPLAESTPSTVSRVPRPALNTPRPGLATPLPSSNAERRTSLVLSTLSSSIARPRVRSTPHTRRTFVGSDALRNSTLALNASRAISETPSSTHILSLHENLSGFEEDSSFVSVESAEDLTNIHRANTSLPVSENPSRQMGVKLHKHLHELNTQQHVLITSLQDENEGLREQLEAAQTAASCRAEISFEELRRLLQEKDEEIAALQQIREEADQRDADVDEELAVLRQQIEMLSHQEDINAAAVALPPSAPSSPVPSADAQKLASLQDLFSQKTVEIESLQDQLAEAKTSAEREILAFDEKTERLESEIMEILTEKESELTLTRSERDSLRESLEKAKEEKSKAGEIVQQEISSLRLEVEEGARGLVDLQARLDSTLETANEKDEIIASLRAAALNTSSDGRIIQLEMELSASQDRCVQLGEDIRQLQSQVRQANDRLQTSEDDLESAIIKLQSAESSLSSSEARLAQAEEELASSKQRLSSTDKEIDELARQSNDAVEREKDHQEELLSLGDKLAAAVALQEQQSAKQEELEASHSEVLAQLKASYSELITSLENAVTKADLQAGSDAQAIASLQKQVNNLEDQVQNRTRLLPSPSPSPSPSVNTSKVYTGIETSFSAGDEVVSQLKSQLFTANKELSRLKADMASSPYRRTALEHKDLRIQVLESLNTNLDSHLGLMRNYSRKLSIGSFRSPNSSFANHSIMSVQTPRSVGTLRKMPWLETPSPAQGSKQTSDIERLQSELDHLNEIIDFNVSKLKDSGKQQLSLSDQLSDTKNQLSMVQYELENQKKKAEGLLWENEQLQTQARTVLSRESSNSVLSIQITSLQTAVSNAKEDIVSFEQARDADRQAYKTKQEALQRAVDDLENQVDEKERALREAIQAKKSFEDDFADLLEKSKKLEQSIHRLQHQQLQDAEVLPAAEAKNSKLESEVKRLGRDLDMAHRDIEQATQHAEHLTELLGQKDATSSGLAVLEKGKASLEGEVRRLNRELSAARQDFEDSVKDLDRLKKTYESKQSFTINEVERLEEEKTELEVKVKHMSKSIGEAEREISELRQSLNNARIDGTTTAQQVTQDLQALRRHKTQQDEKLHTAELALSEAENRCVILNTQLTASKTTTSTLQQTLAQHQSLLSSQTHDLTQYKLQSQQAEAERETVKQEIAILEKELKRARRDAHSLKDEIAALRGEQDASWTLEKGELSRAREQAEEQLKSVEEKLRSLDKQHQRLEQKYIVVDSDLRVAKTDLNNLMASRLQADEEARRLNSELQTSLTDLSNIKTRHSKESKGLLVDIRYLKQKFTRENTFREDLSLQKEYLLILIGQLSRQQSRVYATISQMGYPDQRPAVQKPRTLKGVAHAVIMIIRTRKLAERWRKDSEVKVALANAYERVKSERAVRKAVQSKPIR